MTLHAAKGLEFPVVFMPACDAGLMPFELFGSKTAAEIAEEERLFYVGMTRSKYWLYLSHAQKRTLKGRVLSGKVSPFVLRLQERLLKREERTPVRPRADAEQLTLF
jgi:superfamily I DNA/RNA helicase